MAHIEPAVKEAVSKLSKGELEKLVIKAAQKNREFHDFLFVNYTSGEEAERQLFEEVKADLDGLFRKSYRGISEELRIANMLRACYTRIHQFEKTCKDKEKVLQLVLYVLEIPFSLNTNMFCTCFTAFNYQVYRLVKKSIALFNSIHEDYRIEHAAKIKDHLVILHRTSDHLDYVYSMPQTI